MANRIHSLRISMATPIFLWTRWYRDDCLQTWYICAEMKYYGVWWAPGWREKNMLIFFFWRSHGCLVIIWIVHDTRSRQRRGTNDVKLPRMGKRKAGRLSQREGWPRKPSIKMAFRGEAESNLKSSALSDLYRGGIASVARQSAKHGC